MLTSETSTSEIDSWPCGKETVTTLISHVTPKTTTPTNSRTSTTPLISRDCGPTSIIHMENKLADQLDSPSMEMELPREYKWM